MKKLFIVLLLISFSTLAINKLQAQEMKITKPVQTSAPAVLNYEGVNLMPFEFNGLNFYQSPNDGRLGYYLVQVFFDEDLKITKSEEIYSVPDRKKLNSRDVYSVYYIFKDVVGYLSANVQVSPNGEFYTVSHTEKEGGEYLCVVDIYQNNEQIDSYKFNPADYKDYHFIDLEISNEGEIYILGFEKEKKEKIYSIFELYKDDLSKFQLNKNSEIKFYDMDIVFNNLNELFIISPFVNSDKNMENSEGIAISKFNKKDVIFNYINFDRKEEFNAYQAFDNSPELNIAPNGDIIYVSPNTFCVGGTCKGENIDVFSFSQNGDFKFLQKIDRVSSGIGYETKTFLSKEGIYTFYNNYKGGNDNTSMVCKINYEGDIIFEKRITDPDSKDICTPSFLQKLIDNKFIYYLFIRDENIRILEIID